MFRYFNYEFHNELKACIFHHLVGGSHKYVVHTSFRIGHFVCKGPLWGVDTTPCINGQTYLEALWGWVLNNTCNLEMSGTLVLAATSVMMISIIIIIIISIHFGEQLVQCSLRQIAGRRVLFPGTVMRLIKMFWELRRLVEVDNTSTVANLWGAKPDESGSSQVGLRRTPRLLHKTSRTLD